MSLTAETADSLRQYFAETPITVGNARFMRGAAKETGLLEGQVTDYATQLGLLKPRVEQRREWENQTIRTALAQRDEDASVQQVLNALGKTLELQTRHVKARALSLGIIDEEGRAESAFSDSAPPPPPPPPPPEQRQLEPLPPFPLTPADHDAYAAYAEFTGFDPRPLRMPRTLRYRPESA